MLKRVLALLLAGLGAGCQGGDSSSPALPPVLAPEPAALQLVATHALAPAYADSSINVPVFRQQPIVTLADESYVAAYYDAMGEVRLDRRDTAGALLASKRVMPRLGDALLGDGHASISVGLSSDGHLHVMYGAHATMPYLASFPVTALAAGAPGDDLHAQQWPRRITYPQFYEVGGTLQLWFRSDPERDIHRVAYTPASKTFDAVSEPVLLAGDSAGVYMNQLAQRGDQVALSWVYRLPFDGDVVRNEGLYLLRSVDGGATWHDNRGQAFDGAVDRWTAAPVLALEPQRQPLNQTSSAYGPDGTLYISYYARDAGGVHQIFLARLAADDDTPRSETVSDNETAFDLLGRGTLVLPLSRPQLAISERFVHVLYRHGDDFVVASRPVATPGQWRRQRLEAVPLGAWEPALDTAAWQAQRILRVYVQAARQAPLDRGEPGPPAAAWVYVLAE